MSAKEMLISRINSLTEEQSETLYAFFQAFLPNDTVKSKILSGNGTDKEAADALARIEKRRKPSYIDIDYDKELYEGLMEKYENID